MLNSALSLALGFAILAAARLSGNPSGFGFAVFIGVVLVALASGLHAGALLHLAGFPSAPLRLLVEGVVWLLIAVGTVWILGRAPRDEVLVALGIVPSALGLVGVGAARGRRIEAAVFLVFALLLTALVTPIWIGHRLG